MTSEGQHAGQQAEATSGGGTEPTGSAYGTPRAAGEFPSDPDDQPPSGRAAAPQTGWGPDAYPNSYGPPPYPPSGSGSPFVVPAVPVFGTPNGEAQVPGATSFRSSAQVPVPATEPATGVWGAPPGTDPGHPYHREADDHPYRATASATGSASVPSPADDQADDREHQNHGSAPVADSRPMPGGPLPGGPLPGGPLPGGPLPGGPLPGGPLPSRADRPPFGGAEGPGNPDEISGFNGFVSSSAPDRSGSAREAAGADLNADDRPHGISAFGGQRVRVPGAALNGLGDTPPPVQVGRPTDSAGFHLRGRPERPPVDDQAEQSGFALRGRPERPDVDDQNEHSGFTALPHPRTQAEPPPGAAVGTARPVTASAAVPVASRVTPPTEHEELPASGGSGPRPRVYGRSAPADEPRPADGSGSAPVSPFQSGTSRAEAAEPGTAQGGAYPAGTAQGGAYPAGTAQGGAYPAGAAQAGAFPAGAAQAGMDGHPYPNATGHPFSDLIGDNAPGSPGAPTMPPVGRATASARVAPPAGSPFTASAPPPYPPGSPASFGPGSPASFGPGSPASFGPGSSAMPPDGSDPQVATPYGEHTTDISGRGRAAAADRPGPNSGAAAVPFPYAADVTGRNGSPTAGAGPGIAPAEQNGRPQPEGAFAGHTSQATVTPPGPAETSSWPAQGATTNWAAQGEPANWSAPAGDPEQHRFEAFKPEERAAPPSPADKPEAPNVRMLPVLLGVVLAAVLLVGLAIGVVWLIARPSDSGFDVNAGECVKRNGDKAVTATCGDPGSYQVVSKVDKKEQCADPEQPYVVNPAGDGRNQVLCLKPSS